jgi:serine/threonine protein kinase/tetratricopeptide (TPR) repeat protein
MPSLATGTAIGAYEVVGVLGAGGMGEVLLAWDAKLGRDVAIKILPASLVGDPALQHRFRQESHTLAALSHPAVVQVFDAGEHEGLPYLVMEYVEGQTLRQVMAAGPLPWIRAADLAADIAEGLAAAHEKGIIHRDLKPENLMLTVHGHVKILDFGLAKLREDSSFPPEVRPNERGTLVAGGITDPALALGTADYMSPEQVIGTKVDGRSDLFSLGVILWEMGTGAHPFRRATPVETMGAILKGQPGMDLATDGLPAPLRIILGACLAKEPSRRFQSAHELAEALRSTVTTATNPRPVWHLSRPLRQRPSPQSLIAWLAVALIASASGLHGWRRGRVAPAPAPPPAEKRLPSVLAMPTRVLGSQDFAYLADAVPIGLSTYLAGVGGLDTKVPPSSLQVERWKGDLHQISDAYRADHLVVTTITKQEKRLTLDVQLVDTRNWKVSWGHKYEGTQANYNTLVRQAAEAVAHALAQKTEESVSTSKPVTSSEVELAFGEGMHFQYRYKTQYRDEDFNLAVAAFERVTKLDPRHAEAAAELGLLYLWHSFLRGATHSGVKDGQQSEAWARRALAVDPNCGLAWSVLSGVEGLGRRENASRAVEYALKGVCLAPQQAQVHSTLGQVLDGPGSLGIFMAGARRAMELDPMSLGGAWLLAMGLAWMGRAEEAMQIVDRGLQREPEHALLKYTVKPYVLIRLGRAAEAEPYLVHGGLDPAHTHPFWMALLRGQREVARSLAGTLLADALGPHSRASDIRNSVLFLAPYLVKLEMKTEAIQLMQRGVDMGCPPPLDWLLTDADLRSLQGDPNFRRILRASRDGALEVVRQLDQAKARGELPEYLRAPLEELRQYIAAVT